MISGTLQIKMLSDWHIGSGTGRPGNIDRLVQRDAHHLPYIPAKSLTGMAVN
jgi:CRISPR-associated protein Csx10